MDTELFGICPFTTTQVLLSGKWAILCLHHIIDGPVRFNELLRKMPKMTNATLSAQLKKLEEFGLVQRKSYHEIPPHVEYSLTEIGEQFKPIFDEIENFGYKYIDWLNNKED